jgi:hypothetical protein
MNICTHYGFGDYVVCFGMIAELTKREPVNLYVINHRAAMHIENIKRLYAPLKNVTILSLMSVKYGRELYRDLSQLAIGERAYFDNSPYGQLFNHHSGNI